MPGGIDDIPLTRISDKHTRGIYAKYRVERTDGSSASGQRHHGCGYFVLDITHDPHAVAALRAYADSCADAYPVLAEELRDSADALEITLEKEAQ